MSRHDLVEQVVAFSENYDDIDSDVIRDAMILIDRHRRIDLLVDSHLAISGFSRTQVDTLEAIYHTPARCLTPAELAEFVHLTRSAMTSNLDSLVKQGLIVRSNHPDDRRMIMVSLTKKGMSFCEDYLPRRYRDMTYVLGKLSAKERKVMADCYVKMINGLSELLEEERS